MAHQGVIVTRYEEKTPPKEYLEKVLASYSTSIGFTYVENGAMTLFNSNGTTDFPGIVEQLDNEKGAITFYFGNNETLFDEKDLQPYVLISTEDGHPLVVALGEGDFSGHHKADSAHADFTHVIEDDLRDAIIDLYNQGGKNLDKLGEDLDGPEARKVIQNLIVTRGMIQINLANGNIVIYNKNNPHCKEYDWGITSNTLGFGEEQKPAPKPKMTLRLKAEVAQPAQPAPQPTPATAPAVQPQPSSVPAVPAAPKTDTAIPRAPEEDAIFPNADMKPDKLQGWYKHHRADSKVPVNYKDRPGIKVSELDSKSSLRPMSKHPLPSGGMSEYIPPVIAPKQLEELKTWLTTPGNVKLTKDLPRTVSDLEAKHPPIWDRLKDVTEIQPETVVQWDFTTRRNFTKNFLQSTAVLARDLSFWLMRVDADLQKKLEEKPVEELPAARPKLKLKM